VFVISSRKWLRFKEVRLGFLVSPLEFRGPLVDEFR
jgi:hypothetical protein